MEEAIMELFSADPCRQLAGTKRFRTLIHRVDPTVPLDPLVFERGVVRRLVDFLRQDAYPQLQVGTLFMPIEATHLCVPPPVQCPLGTCEYYRW